MIFCGLNNGCVQVVTKIHIIYQREERKGCEREKRTQEEEREIDRERDRERERDRHIEM